MYIWYILYTILNIIESLILNVYSYNRVYFNRLYYTWYMIQILHVRRIDFCCCYRTQL